MLRLGRVYAEYILRRLSLCTLARVAAVKSLSNPLWIVLLCVSVCVREKNSSIVYSLYGTSINTLYIARALEEVRTARRGRRQVSAPTATVATP